MILALFYLALVLTTVAATHTAREGGSRHLRNVSQKKLGGMNVDLPIREPPTTTPPEEAINGNGAEANGAETNGEVTAATPPKGVAAVAQDKLIVGVDFGTTYSGRAFHTLREVESHV
ncbi:hypothetical protein LTR16_002572 [Cryomyces antarcticus]|uniref:Uncharacterized protein n=1 Tax=Cryomyces antarcticus TaxID=329879 RepID=A0ABR0M7V3_9PEZI|nr:hypothetical protein LTR60_005144 [Cryomyces antarcticus]KAK5017264.1 hypothetical protein LTR39_001643 [Cryomyces antarcticus]KAK5290532.1 hypothetical protein LTR16_002572 [Cryomyces antarcticus]